MKRSLDESKQKIAHLEEARNVQQKEGEDLRANLRELEKARQEARREIQQLNNQVGFLIFKILLFSIMDLFKILCRCRLLALVVVFQG